MEKDERGGKGPESAGTYIAKIAMKKNVKPLYAIDFISKAECVLFRILPNALSNFIVGKMYAQ